MQLILDYALQHTVSKICSDQANLRTTLAEAVASKRASASHVQLEESLQRAQQEASEARALADRRYHALQVREDKAAEASLAYKQTLADSDELRSVVRNQHVQLQHKGVQLTQHVEHLNRVLQVCCPRDK